MPLSDFDAATFWPAIRQFVEDMGVEPISLGEPEDETWPKIFDAMELNGTPLSFGMDEGQIRRTLAAALAEGVGAARYAPYPAPSGYRWALLTEYNETLTDLGERQVELQRAA